MKSKKILSLLLALIMIISCAPIYASAAVSMSKANATLVEAPKLSYNGGEPTLNLVVPGGATKADITIVGGKVAYEGTEVEGFFSWSSSVTGTPSTTVLAVGDVTVALYFHPTDTTTYSRGSWRPSASAPIEGWPTLAVDGLDATIVEAPTVSGFLPTGNRLNTLTLSGGKVVDADGNDITANGTWSFVNATTIPTESGEQQVQWKLKGYDVPKTSIYVTVKFIQATLAEAPTVNVNLDPGDVLNTARIKSGTGKVVDENGNDITANGKWAVDKTQVPNDVLIWRDTTVPVTWSATGYQTVTAQMAVGCNQPEAYYIDAVPTFAEAGQTLKYSPKQTWGSLTFIPGKVTDKVTGEEIPGTYELYTDLMYKNRAENVVISVSNVYSYGKESKFCYVKFVPTDTSLPAHEFGTSSRVYCDKGEFTLVEGTEVVVMYGVDDTALIKSGAVDDLKFSTFKTEPEGVEIKSVVWDKSVFDPSTADYGTVTMVEATVEARYGFNEQVLTVPVRIMPYVYDYTNPWYGWSTSLMFWSTFQEEPDGIRNYKVDFTNKRLKGTVDLYVNDELITSVTPDENGKFYAEGQWIAPASGDYTYRYEYKPTPEDTATVTNPIYPTGESKDFTIELRPYRTLTINVGDQVYTITDRAGSRIYFNWLDETGLKLEDFSSWTFTDPNGKEFTPEKALESEDDPKQKASIHIIMPDHDTTATAKGTSIDGDVSSDGGLGSLWSFWQKLINFIVEIYRTIMDFFVPAVETY